MFLLTNANFMNRDQIIEDEDEANREFEVELSMLEDDIHNPDKVKLFKLVRRGYETVGTD